MENYMSKIETAPLEREEVDRVIAEAYKRLVPNFGVTEFQDHNGVYGPAGTRYLTLRFNRGTDTIEIELVVQKVTSSKADAMLHLQNMESK